MISPWTIHANSFTIVELTRRRWIDLLVMFFAMPSHLVVPFFAKKFSFSKFLFTTIIPIVPFMVAFDGLVSALRSYKKEEIIAMLPANWQDDFEVEYKELPTAVPLMKSTIFTLIRKNKSA